MIILELFHLWFFCFIFVHRTIEAEFCSAVFSWTNLLVIAVELDGPEGEALDLVPIVTNVVLEDHHLVVGIVVVGKHHLSFCTNIHCSIVSHSSCNLKLAFEVDPGTVPINSRGEKQR